MIVRGMAVLQESGSTDDIDVSTTSTWSSSLGTTDVIGIGSGEGRARRHGLIPKSWSAAVWPYALAVMVPMTEIEHRRRQPIFTGSEHVIVLGERVGAVDFEHESIFAMRSDRPTLWLPSVPILPQRRPYIPPWDPSDLPDE